MRARATSLEQGWAGGRPSGSGGFVAGSQVKARTGSDWIGLDLAGPAWPGPDWIGHPIWPIPRFLDCSVRQQSALRHSWRRRPPSKEAARAADRNMFVKISQRSPPASSSLAATQTSERLRLEDVDFDVVIYARSVAEALELSASEKGRKEARISRLASVLERESDRAKGSRESSRVFIVWGREMFANSLGATRGSVALFALRALPWLLIRDGQQQWPPRRCRCRKPQQVVHSGSPSFSRSQIPANHSTSGGRSTGPPPLSGSGDET